MKMSLAYFCNVFSGMREKANSKKVEHKRDRWLQDLLDPVLLGSCSFFSSTTCLLCAKRSLGFSGLKDFRGRERLLLIMLAL